MAACRALFDRGEAARLWVVEIGGEVIGAQLFVRVGSRRVPGTAVSTRRVTRSRLGSRGIVVKP